MDNPINPLPNRDTSNNSAMLVAIIVLAIALVLTLIASVSFYLKTGSRTSLKRLELSTRLRIATEQAERNLDEYLLAGAASSLDQLSQNEHDLQDAIEKLRDADSSPEARLALNSLSNAYQTWSLRFAQPLIQKRKDVDAGDSTVMELQIFYLNQDPAEKFNTLKDAVARIQSIEMRSAQE